MVLALMLALSAAEPSAPRDLGMRETAGVELIQVQVTATGANAVEVRPEHFRVSVNGKIVPGVQVDPLATTSPGAGPFAGPAASYLFYFDQPFLTVQGRQRALEIARWVAPRLVEAGGRVAVVSNGRRVERFTGLTSDPEKLRGALDRLESAPDHRDNRIPWEVAALAELDAEVTDALDEFRSRYRYASNKSNSRNALDSSNFNPIGGSTANSPRTMAEPQRDLGTSSLSNPEIIRFRQRLESALQRATSEGERAARVVKAELLVLRQVATAFAGLQPPRAIVYFGDTLRLRPTDPLVRRMEERVKEALDRLPQNLEPMQGLTPDWSKEDAMGVPTASDPETVLAELGTAGIPILAIQAEGLSNDPLADSAASSLASLALETGGQPFLHGMEPARIAEETLARLGRTWLVSFPAGGLPTGRTLALRVDVDGPRVRLAYPPRVRVPAAGDRMRARIVRDAVWTEEQRLPVSAGLVPLGFEKGRFRALAQARVDAGDVSIGLALSGEGDTGGAWESDAAGSGPTTAEWVVSLTPGPGLLIVSARDDASAAGSAQVALDWPDPEEGVATVLPIAVLQPATGSFLRDGQPRPSGTRLLGEADPVDPARPAALVALVCRGPKAKGPLSVCRSLDGETTLAFPDAALAPGEEACASFRDVIPAGTLGSGSYLYSVRVVQGEDEVLKAGRVLEVPE